MKPVLKTLAAAAFLLPALAHGASLQMLWDADPYNPGSPTDLVHFNVPGNSGDTHPDRYHGQASGFVGIAGSDLIDGGVGDLVSLFTYCYELTEYFSGGQSVTYTINYGGVLNDTLDFLGGVNSALGGNQFAWLHPADVTTAAAIQIGIWQSLYGAGAITDIDGVTMDRLNTFHTAALTANNLGSAYVIKLENHGAQDQISGIRGVGQQVPEPGSLALLAMGLAAGSLALRRRSRV